MTLDMARLDDAHNTFASLERSLSSSPGVETTRPPPLVVEIS